MAEADGVQVDLVPEWLAKGHSFHSPGTTSTFAGLRDNKHGRGSSSSATGRGLLTLDSPLLQHHHRRPPGVDLLLTTSRSEERSANPSPGSYNSSSSSSRSDTRGFASTQQHRSSLGSSRRVSPFSPASGRLNSSGRTQHLKGVGVATAAPESYVDEYAQGQRSGLQRAFSKGSGHHSFTGSDDVHQKDSSSHGSRAHGAAAARKLNLTLLNFPSLSSSNGGSSSPPSSSNKHSSPDLYTPSVAPYKEGFLASRGSAGWTSKLADVPSAGAAASVRISPASAAAAAKAQQLTARATSDASSSIASTSGSESAAGASSPAPVQAAADDATEKLACKQPSLADTLKQAAAVTSSMTAQGKAADLQRRHSKMLVPLLPGCKAKHGASTPRTVSAPVVSTIQQRREGPGARKSASDSAARSASRAVYSGASASDVQSPASQLQLLKLRQSNSTSAVAPGPTVCRTVSHDTEAPVALQLQDAPQGAAGHTTAHAHGATDSAGGSHAVQSDRIGHSNSASGVVTGSAVSAGPSELRQQLSDRNSFFAVLRRKTSMGGSTQQELAHVATVSDGGGSNDENSSGGGGVNTAAQEAPLCSSREQQGSLSTESNAPAVAAVAVQEASPVSTADQTQHCPVHQQTQELLRPTADAFIIMQPQRQPGPAVAQDSMCDVSLQSSTASSLQDDRQHIVQMESARLMESETSQLQHNTAQCEDQHHIPQSEDEHSVNLLWGVPAEEEAFLRSLGWTADSLDNEDEWCLTEEEISAFQAAAAARAAQREQHQQQAQLSPTAAYAQNSFTGLSLLQQKALLQGYRDAAYAVTHHGSAHHIGCKDTNADGCAVVRAASLGQAGVLLGVRSLPMAGLLGLYSCSESSSSSDDDDADADSY